MLSNRNEKRNVVPRIQIRGSGNVCRKRITERVMAVKTAETREADTGGVFPEGVQGVGTVMAVEKHEIIIHWQAEVNVSHRLPVCGVYLRCCGVLSEEKRCSGAVAGL